MKTVAIYARVSQDEQAKGYSLPTQIDACRQFAAERGYTVVAEFREDYTGTTVDRPELDKVYDLARQGAITGLVVLELDRLARGLAKQIIIEDELARQGVTVDYVLASYDDTPEGGLQKNIRATIAEYERLKFMQRCERGKKGRAQAGQIVPGGLARYGYRYVKEPHKGRYEIVEHEAEIVKLIYSLYTGDEKGRKLGMRQIAAHLTRLKVPTRSDGSKYPKKRGFGVWAKSTIAHILTDETYAGTAYYNKTRKGATGAREARPREEWIAIPVPAIIDRATWEAAQEQIGRNTIESPRNTHEEYLMQGRLRCAVCGSTLYCFTDRRKEPGTSYYYCRGTKRINSPDGTVTCHHALRADRLDAAVWGYVKKGLKKPKSLLLGFEAHRGEYKGQAQTLTNRLAALSKEIAKLERSKARNLDYLLSDNPPLPREELAAKLSEINGMIEQLTADSDGLQRQIEKTDHDQRRLERVMQYCAQVRQGIDNFGYGDRRAAIEALNVTGTVLRGESAGLDSLLVRGFFLDDDADPIAAQPSEHRSRKIIPFSSVLAV